MRIMLSSFFLGAEITGEAQESRNSSHPTVGEFGAESRDSRDGGSACLAGIRTSSLVRLDRTTIQILRIVEPERLRKLWIDFVDTRGTSRRDQFPASAGGRWSQGRSILTWRRGGLPLSANCGQADRRCRFPKKRLDKNPDPGQ